MSYCTNCGKAVEEKSNFCISCGNEIVRTENFSNLASKSSAPAAPAPAQPQIIVMPPVSNNTASTNEMAKFLSNLLDSVKSIVVLVAVGFFLSVTNPSTADFLIFAKQKIQENGGGGANTFIATFWISLVEEVTFREDYYFWSVHTVDTSLFAASDSNIPQRLKFVGIGRMFFPTSESELRRVMSKIGE